MKESIINITSKVLSILPGINNIFINGKKEVMSIEEKDGVGNIVTSVDKQIEEYIKSNLSKLFPQAQIISEESADSCSNENEPKSSLKFVVDPLDGTTNYTNGWPHTVAIGVVNDNELVSGIIYDVLSNKVYTGMKGLGVTEQNINNLSEQNKVAIPAYSQATIKKAPISYDTPYGRDAFEITKEMNSELYHSGASLKTVGPISLDVLKTALGKENRPNDYNAATWHTEVRAWDLAAATCILRELGGDIIGKDGKPLTDETLSSPTARIAFIASGSEKLRMEMYEKYKSAEKRVDSRTNDR